MAFSTRRGRPPSQNRSITTDSGTPELRLKHALGLTAEPIDLCLARQLITPAQHRSGLHLRWLYTLRYGAPSLTTRYVDPMTASGAAEQSEQWRGLREREYHEAAALLRQRNHYEATMRLCVFNELPAFLSPALSTRAWGDPALAQQLQLAHAAIRDGLDLLEQHWRRRPAPAANSA